MESRVITSCNPSDGYRVIGHVAQSTTQEIDTNIAAAHAAQKNWSTLDIKKRIEILEPLYTAFHTRQKEISLLAAQEMGMPINVSTHIDLYAGLGYMRGYLDHAHEWLSPEVVFENNQEIHYQVYEAHGVVGMSVPWNYPFCNFIWGVIPHLLAGNTVVFKHSEECPLTGKLLEEIMSTVKLPHGICSQVYGTGNNVGEYLMNSAIDYLHFTGSTAVGMHLYQKAAQKCIPVMLELGGSAPGIVFEDADLPSSLASVYFYRFINSGQTCDGLKRLIVHESILDTVLQNLSEALRTKKVGNAQNQNTDIGPLVAERQLVLLEEQVADAVAQGARIVIGGNRPEVLTGAYYNPTLLTNITPNMRVWKEEVFGPVLPVVTFRTEDEAIALANDTRYGLGGYVYTTDTTRALRVSKQLKTGNVSVNNINYNIVQDAFGGYKDSGIGREHGKLGLRSLCHSKIIALPKKRT